MTPVSGIWRAKLQGSGTGDLVSVCVVEECTPGFLSISSGRDD